MAAMREELVLVDRFTSTLDRYAQKLGAGARMTQAAAATVEGQNGRMAGSTQSASVRMVQSAEQASTGVSDATQSLVDRLALAEENMRGAFTDSQGDAELNRLQSQMQRLGLVWTSAADEADSANKIMEFGLETLAQQGRLTANVLAQTAYETQLEKEAAQQAAQAQGEHAGVLRRLGDATGKAVGWLGRHTQELFKNITATHSARQAHGGLERQLRRVLLTVFSVSKIFRFLSDTIERAPKGIQNSWGTMVSGIKDTFARGFLSMLEAMQPAIDRFNAFMESSAGQRFARGLETAMTIAGNAVGWLLDKVTALGAWIGDNFVTVFTVAGALLAVFAGKMLLTAIATMAENLSILLLIALVAGVVFGLQAAGFTAQETFGMISGAVATAGAFIANVFFGLVELVGGVIEFWYNGFVDFANFFANVFNDPIGSVIHLFGGMADKVVGVIEKIASAMDFVFGSHFADTVAGWRSGLSSLVEDAANKYGNGSYKKLMEHLDVNAELSKLGITMERFNYGDSYQAGYNWGSDLADKFSSFSLDSKLTPYLANIDTNTGKTAKNTADASDEDLKYLEDVAVRRYEAHVNTTTLTPSITVNVKGSADKEGAGDIAAAIATILAQQAASHTSLSYAEVGV